MRKRFLAGVLAAAVLATAFIGITHRAGIARAATSYWWVCDTSSTNTRCAQLYLNKYTADNPVILNAPSTTDLSFAWYRQQIDTVSAGAGFPFTGVAASLNTYYNGDPVVQIFKHTSSGHDGCMGIGSSTAPQVGWETCGSSTLGVPNTTEWIFHVPDSSHPNIGYLVNVGWTQHISNGDGTATKTLLSVGYSSSGACNDSTGSILQVERQAPDPTSCNRAWYFNAQ